ncbi:hypothetical protein SCD75_09585 [Prescottella equi]|nr:hypothetical protein SCD75_09585 [Prescottella equi]
MAETLLQRRPEADLCWWCDAPATTSEHKFKQTDLRKVQGSDSFYYHFKQGEHGGRVKGSNSKRVKFRKNLCAPCNNARSQPFDVAYDRLSSYLGGNVHEIYAMPHLDMSAVFGQEDVRGHVLNLARYFMKYFGCRIDDSGFTVPKEIRDFCSGGEFMPGVQIVFFRDRALDMWCKRTLATGAADFPLYHSPLQAGLDTETGLPISLSGESIIGNAGIIYTWTGVMPERPRPFYVNPTAELHERSTLPFDSLYSEWPDHLSLWRRFF